MTPYPSDEARKAAHARRAKPAAPKKVPVGRVPIRKAPEAFLPTEKGSTLELELRLGLHPVALEVFHLVLPLLLRELGKMSRRQLRKKCDFVIHELTAAMVDGEGLPQDRARFLAFQALKAAQRADFRAALLAPRKRAETMPASPFRTGYEEALEQLYVAADGLPTFDAELRMQVRGAVAPTGEGRQTEQFSEGVEAALKDAEKGFKEADP